MIIKCDFCGKELDKPINKVNEARKNKWKMYCSPECRNKARKIRCVCANCGKELWKTPSEISRSKTGNVFCNKSCACSYNNSHFRSGENNPNWRGGKVGSSAHTITAFRTYKKKCTVCGIQDEDMLEVHHIDLNHNNNDPDNLIVLCSNHHSKVHRGNLEITEEIKSRRETLLEPRLPY